LTREYRLKITAEEAFEFLNTPETFTKGQPFPYKVEFTSPDPDAPADFRVGVYNVHYGPFLNASAVITAIDPPRHRAMEYTYGAFVISPRLIRPTDLIFDFEPADDGGCVVRLEFRSYVRPFFRPIWNLGLKTFWSLFRLALPRRKMR
jgi:hypothetical protein